MLSLAEWEDPQVLVLNDSARKRVTDYLAAIEPRLRPDGDLYVIRDWAAKPPGGRPLVHPSRGLRRSSASVAA